jgi:hypothetical protein
VNAPTIGLVNPYTKLSRWRPVNSGLRLSPIHRRGDGERLTQARFIYPPVVVFNPVDQRHRNQLPIGIVQHGVIKYRQLNPPDAQILRDSLDDLTHRTAQVAAGLGQKGDPRGGTVSHAPTV